MAQGFEHCSNCGAPVELAPDGRSVSCTYCGGKERRAVDPVHLANALRSDLQSSEALLERLARELGAAFPELTEVRTSGGLLTARRVAALEVKLEGAMFRMRRDSGRVHAERVKVVRGIALKTEALAVDAWVEALCQALAGMSSQSASVHTALARLSGSRHGE